MASVVRYPSRPSASHTVAADVSSEETRLPPFPESTYPLNVILITYLKFKKIFLNEIAEVRFDFKKHFWVHHCYKAPIPLPPPFSDAK